jgi:Tol biopolymer transport system component
VTTGTELAGLASFTSAHSGSHRLYTIDRTISGIRVVTDNNTRAASTNTINVVDASGNPVSLSGASDLVAGKHPARPHPFGRSPYTAMYASTSAGDIWLISPISGAFTWRAYKVAEGLGAITSLAYDNCPTAAGDSTRAAGTDCVFATTAAGIVTVPMTNTTRVTVEAPRPAAGPAGAVGLASNTPDGLAGSGNGAFFTTSGATFARTNWSGTANTLTLSGTAMTAPAGIGWMANNFYVADAGGRRLFQVTPSGARSVVAGSGTAAAVDGTGTGASFANPTRVHHHGTANVVYVLDAPCIRRVNVASGAVTSLLCPGQSVTSPLMRVDSPQAAPVFSPTFNVPTGTVSGAFSFLAEITEDGEWVYFDSNRTDVAAADTTADTDIFRKNLSTGEVQLITTGTNGAPAAGSGPRISADGSVVAYFSGKVFYVTTISGSTMSTTTIIDVGTFYDANTVGDVSRDGSKVALMTDRPIVAGDSGFSDDVYVYNVGGGTFFRASSTSAGTSGGATSAVCSSSGTFSPDGNRVAFSCTHATLVAGDTNGVHDVFVKDISSGTSVGAIQRASTTAAGSQVPASSHMAGLIGGGSPHLAGGGSLVFSPDGNIVLFSSTSPDLVGGDTNTVVDMFAKNLTTGEIRRITGPGGAELAAGSYAASFTPDGTRIAFATGSSLVAADTTGDDIYMSAADGSGAYRLVSMTGTGTGGAWIATGSTQMNISLSNDRIAYHLRYVSSGNQRYLATRLLG